MIINDAFAKKNKLSLQQLRKPLPVRNVDGSSNKLGAVVSTTIQTVHLWTPQNHYHKERSEFCVTNIGQHDIILGTDWLKAHNPEVNWSTSQLAFTRCPSSCSLSIKPLIICPATTTSPAIVISTLDPSVLDFIETPLEHNATAPFVAQHQLFKYHKPSTVNAKTMHSTDLAARKMDIPLNHILAQF